LIPGDAASDQMAAAQVRLGHLPQRRSTPSTVAVGDKVWLDSKQTPVDIPYKLTARWFGPFEVTLVHRAQVTLNLPKTFGKAHHRVNIRRLNFSEARDECFGAVNERPTPLQGHADVTRYEVICNLMHESIRDNRSSGLNGRARINRTIVGCIGMYLRRMCRRWCEHLILGHRHSRRAQQRPSELPLVIRHRSRQRTSGVSRVCGRECDQKEMRRIRKKKEKNRHPICTVHMLARFSNMYFKDWWFLHPK